MNLTPFEMTYLAVTFVLLVAAGTRYTGKAADDGTFVFWSVFAVLWPVLTPLVLPMHLGMYLRRWWSKKPWA